MKTHKYKTGDIVDIYEDPITKTKPEGKARIVRQCNRENYYQVCFFEDEPQNFYYRFIY